MGSKLLLLLTPFICLGLIAGSFWVDARPQDRIPSPAARIPLQGAQGVELQINKQGLSNAIPFRTQSDIPVQALAPPQKPKIKKLVKKLRKKQKNNTQTGQKLNVEPETPLLTGPDLLQDTLDKLHEIQELIKNREILYSNLDDNGIIKQEPEFKEPDIKNELLNTEVSEQVYSENKNNEEINSLINVEQSLSEQQIYVENNSNINKEATVALNTPELAENDKDFLTPLKEINQILSHENPANLIEEKTDNEITTSSSEILYSENMFSEADILTNEQELSAIQATFPTQDNLNNMSDLESESSAENIAEEQTDDDNFNEGIMFSKEEVLNNEQELSAPQVVNKPMSLESQDNFNSISETIPEESLVSSTVEKTDNGNSESFHFVNEGNTDPGQESPTNDIESSAAQIYVPLPFETENTYNLENSGVSKPEKSLEYFNEELTNSETFSSSLELIDQDNLGNINTAEEILTNNKEINTPLDDVLTSYETNTQNDLENESKTQISETSAIIEVQPNANELEKPTLDSLEYFNTDNIYSHEESFTSDQESSASQTDVASTLEIESQDNLENNNNLIPKDEDLTDLNVDPIDSFNSGILDESKQTLNNEQNLGTSQSDVSASFETVASSPEILGSNNLESFDTQQEGFTSDQELSASQTDVSSSLEIESQDTLENNNNLIPKDEDLSDHNVEPNDSNNSEILDHSKPTLNNEQDFSATQFDVSASFETVASSPEILSSNNLESFDTQQESFTSDQELSASQTDVSSSLEIESQVNLEGNNNVIPKDDGLANLKEGPIASLNFGMIDESKQTLNNDQDFSASHSDVSAPFETLKDQDMISAVIPDHDLANNEIQINEDETVESSPEILDSNNLESIDTQQESFTSDQEISASQTDVSSSLEIESHDNLEGSNNLIPKDEDSTDPNVKPIDYFNFGLLDESKQTLHNEQDLGTSQSDVSASFETVASSPEILGSNNLESFDTQQESFTSDQELSASQTDVSSSLEIESQDTLENNNNLIPNDEDLTDHKVELFDSFNSEILDQSKPTLNNEQDFSATQSDVSASLETVASSPENLDSNNLESFDTQQDIFTSDQELSALENDVASSLEIESQDNLENNNNLIPKDEDLTDLNVDPIDSFNSGILDESKQTLNNEQNIGTSQSVVSASFETIASSPEILGSNNLESFDTQQESFTSDQELSVSSSFEIESQDNLESNNILISKGEDLADLNVETIDSFNSGILDESKQTLNNEQNIGTSQSVVSASFETVASSPEILGSNNLESFDTQQESFTSDQELSVSSSFEIESQDNLESNNILISKGEDLADLNVETIDSLDSGILDKSTQALNNEQDLAASHSDVSVSFQTENLGNVDSNEVNFSAAQVEELTSVMTETQNDQLIITNTKPEEDLSYNSVEEINDYPLALNSETNDLFDNENINSNLESLNIAQTIGLPQNNGFHLLEINTNSQDIISKPESEESTTHDDKDQINNELTELGSEYLNAENINSNQGLTIIKQELSPTKEVDIPAIHETNIQDEQASISESNLEEGIAPSLDSVELMSSEDKYSNQEIVDTIPELEASQTYVFDTENQGNQGITSELETENYEQTSTELVNSLNSGNKNSNSESTHNKEENSSLSSYYSSSIENKIQEEQDSVKEPTLEQTDDKLIASSSEILILGTSGNIFSNEVSQINEQNLSKPEAEVSTNLESETKDDFENHGVSKEEKFTSNVFEINNEDNSKSSTELLEPIDLEQDIVNNDLEKSSSSYNYETDNGSFSTDLDLQSDEDQQTYNSGSIEESLAITDTNILDNSISIQDNSNNEIETNNLSDNIVEDISYEYYYEYTYEDETSVPLESLNEQEAIPALTQDNNSDKDNNGLESLLENEKGEIKEENDKSTGKESESYEYYYDYTYEEHNDELFAPPIDEKQQIENQPNLIIEQENNVNTHNEINSQSASSLNSNQIISNKEENDAASYEYYYDYTYEDYTGDEEAIKSNEQPSIKPIPAETDSLMQSESSDYENGSFEYYYVYEYVDSSEPVSDSLLVEQSVGNKDSTNELLEKEHYLENSMLGKESGSSEQQNINIEKIEQSIQNLGPENLNDKLTELSEEAINNDSNKDVTGEIDFQNLSHLSLFAMESNQQEEGTSQTSYENMNSKPASNEGNIEEKENEALESINQESKEINADKESGNDDLNIEQQDNVNSANYEHSISNSVEDFVDASLGNSGDYSDYISEEIDYINHLDKIPSIPLLSSKELLKSTNTNINNFEEENLETDNFSEKRKINVADINRVPLNQLGAKDENVDRIVFPDIVDY